MEKINTLKPSYKIMHVILNQCLRVNGGKGMFVILLFWLISSVISSLPVVPFMLGSMQGGLSLGTIVFSMIFSVAVIVIFFIMSYGQQVVFFRIVEKSNTKTGDLFCGFTDKTRKVFYLSLVLTAIVLGVTVLSFAVTKNILSSLGLFTGYENLLAIDTEKNTLLMNKSVPVFVTVMAIAVGLAVLPFTYLWIVIYRRKDLGIFRAMRISVSLLFKQFFRFVGFVFYSAAPNLIAFVILWLIIRFIPANGESISFLSMLSTFLSFFLLIQEFNVLVRVNFAVPIYFYSMTGVLQVHLSEYKPDENSADGNDAEESGPLEIDLGDGPDVSSENDSSKDED